MNSLDDCDDSHVGFAVGWRDWDGDGWGGAWDSACDPAELAAVSGDCDDGDAAIHPGAAEVCDSRFVDENCDGLVHWYEDLDGDGYGAGEGTCDGTVHRRGDCDDADPTLSPDRAEICGNGLDDDCDGNALPCALEGRIGLDEAVGSVAGWPLASGDLDGDGVVDLVTATENAETGLVEVYFGPLRDGAAPDLVFELARNIQGGAILDLDGDGWLDLAAGVPVALGEGAARIHVRYGPIVAGKPSVWTADGVPYVIRGAGDTDGDGREELLLGDLGTTWLVQGRHGDGLLPAHVVVEARAAPAGDLDGDGLGDLGVYGEAGPCALGVVLAPFAPVVQLQDARFCRSPEPPPRELAGVGDVDGDGLADIVVGFWSGRDSYDDSTAAGFGWLLSGAALSADAGAALRQDGGHYVGDVDGDGVDDLLLRDDGQWNSGGCSAGDWALRASGGTVASFALTCGPGGAAVPAADYDGDGRTDVLLGARTYPAGGGWTGRSWWFSAAGEAW